MNDELALLKSWLQEVAACLQENQDPGIDFYEIWLEQPNRVLTLVDLIDSFADQELDEHENEYSACIVAVDICVANLQSALENGQKTAERLLERLMKKLADKMLEKQHDLSFWMPILNSFYDAQVPLCQELRDAYLMLASEMDVEGEPEDVLQNIRNMIQELSHHNLYEIAEHIFAQSNVMPPEFFAELLFDLFLLEEGQDIALLSLMHPNPEVREVALEVIDQVLPDMVLSNAALSRMQAISYWYPEDIQYKFKQWIKAQRRQGVVFARPPHAHQISFRACEIDGTGTQGIVMRMKHQKKPLVAGMLFKKGIGIKDVWVSPVENSTQADQQFKHLFGDDLYAREVDVRYFEQMTNHFLYETLSLGQMPDLQLLYVQELLGIQFRPQCIEVSALIEEISVQIHPFTPEIIADALKKSSRWMKNAAFAHNWFEENSEIDVEVNQCCTIEKGTKYCDLNHATERIFKHIFSHEQEKWRFHFLWNALFLRSKARAQERSWRDCFLIAYFIDQGGALDDIPIMQGIAQRTVINSMETMMGRGTYLSQL